MLPSDQILLTIQNPSTQAESPVMDALMLLFLREGRLEKMYKYRNRVSNYRSQIAA